MNLYKYNFIKKIKESLFAILDSDTIENQAKPAHSSLPANEFAAFFSETNLIHFESIKIGLPSDNPLRGEVLFRKLSPYFYSGLLYRRVDSTESFQAISGFYEGDEIPETTFSNLPKLKFDIELGEGKKLDASILGTFSKSLGLTQNEKKMIGFFPHQDFVFLLVTELPDLFLKSHLEEIFSKCLIWMVDDL